MSILPCSKVDDIGPGGRGFDVESTIITLGVAEFERNVFCATMS